MKHDTKRRRPIRLAGTLAAAVLMLALAPLNMGGCSAGSLGDAIGNTVGGMTGNLISAGGKATEAVMMNETHENALGQSVAVAITNEYKLDPNVALNRYVTLVGMTVASGSPRPDGPYVFGVLDSDEVNAFAGPNGYIMITRGTIMKMQDESELAGVLAHEIAHVIDRHGFNAVQKAKLVDAGVQAAQSNADIARWGRVTDIGVDFVKNGYSRDQEATADLRAVDYLVATGYDPQGYQRFLQRMAAANSSGGVDRLMSSHPGLGDRATRVSLKIQQKGKPGGATLADRFKKHVAKPAA